MLDWATTGEDRLFGDLTAWGEGPALVGEECTLDWSELADRIEQRAGQWRHARRLVMLSGRNSIDFVVNYLAALEARCPVLVAPACAAEALALAWDPDIVVDADTDTVDVRREVAAHDLHPDLALLLSTSGSTGSPKLVRLSRGNLRSNATSIADYLGLSPDDCGMTSLPLHYCYGLSVLHSHLLVGAPVAISDASVLDGRFWEVVERAGVSSLAGVPHTFDLLDHSGFLERNLPRLRCLTQAGGRMDPDRVRAWRELGQRRGWDFVVMYGQTEATARMAWLPPELAAEHPQSIGRAVPGGSFRLAPPPDQVPDQVPGAGDDAGDCALDDGIGELVYSGPNVMMGYAEHPTDLALAPMEPVLHTGDLARELGDGLFEVVGRLKRFTKVFGLRVNLDDVERSLAAGGVRARVVGNDDVLTVFVTRRRDRGRAAGLAVDACGVPAWVVRVEVLEAIPVTSNGKPDYARLNDLARERGTDRRGEGTREVDPEQLRQLYARILNRPDARLEDSFVGLGADSLSYVEMSVRLGERIDPLPTDWHNRSIGSLAGAGRHSRWGRALDTNVLLRALAIIFIVGSHSEAWVLVGGAHLLLALAGYNFARFHLSADGAAPWRRIGWALTAIVVPASLWLAAVALATGEYAWRTVLYLNWTRGTTWWDDQWRFWFLEALVWALVVLAALLSVKGVRSFEAKHPFGVACAVLVATLSLRWWQVGVTAVGEQKYALATVLWAFALGWVLARSVTGGQRVFASMLVLVSVIDFFDDDRRELLIILGLLVALWLPRVRVPRMVASAVGVVAAASLAIYVTQWQVYPHLERDHPYLAVLASLVVGVGYHQVTRPLMLRLRAGQRREGNMAMPNAPSPLIDVHSGGPR